MSTVTPRHNFTKPASLEKYSLPTFNGNLDKIDAAIPLTVRASSTLNSAQWDFTGSTFVRLTVGTTGIVMASFSALLKSGQNTTIPDNTSTGNNIQNVIPAGMRAKESVGYEQGPVFSGEGRGDNLQARIEASSASIFVRSAGASFNRASNGGVFFHWNSLWEWDGVV